MASNLRDLISIVPNIMSDPNNTNPQFSIKNFDTAELPQVLTAHQNSFIKLALIVVSLVIAGWMFNNHHTKEQAIRTQMSQAQQKLEAIKDRDTAVKNLDDFKAALPKKLNEFELIALISNYAKSEHVTIASLSPAESKDAGLYDIINVSFNATCEDFRHMIFFLRQIEGSKFPLRVNAWSGHEAGNGQINFIIEISAILIHT